MRLHRRLLTVVFTVACALSAASASALAQAPVPFVANMSAMTTPVGTGTAPGNITYVMVTGQGSGTATQLGKYTAALNFDLVPAALSPTLVEPFAGTITFTAANGDTLKAVFAGSYDSETTWAGYIQFIDGGTGRFTHASGSGTIEGTDEGSPFAFNAEINATIAFKK